MTGYHTHFARVTTIALSLLLINVGWAGTAAAESNCLGGDDAYYEVCPGTVTTEEEPVDYFLVEEEDSDDGRICIAPTGTYYCLTPATENVLLVQFEEKPSVSVNGENVIRDFCDIIGDEKCNRPTTAGYADADGDGLLDGVFVDFDGNSVYVPSDV